VENQSGRGIFTVSLKRRHPVPRLDLRAGDGAAVGSSAKKKPLRPQTLLKDEAAKVFTPCYPSRGKNGDVKGTSPRGGKNVGNLQRSWKALHGGKENTHRFNQG